MSLSFLWALLVKDPLIILATIFMGSISVCVSFFDPDHRICDAIARRWAGWLVSIAGIKLRVRGLENIDPNQSYVFAGNHLSLYDTPVILSSVPNRFLFLVNERYVKIPFLGTHLRRTGHFSVNREDVRGSLRILTQAAAAMRQRGVSVLLFPEGARALDEIGEFREGAAYIAVKAGVPVIPFALTGTREVLPIGSVHVKGGPVELVFGPPIATDGYALKNRAELNRQLFDAVSRLLREARS